MYYKNKLGTFTFPAGTLLSRAKLIATEVMGAFLAPKPGDHRLRTDMDCYRFAEDFGVEFKLEFANLD